MIRPGMVILKEKGTDIVSHIVVTDVHVSVNLQTIITVKEIIASGHETMNGNFTLERFLEEYGDCFVAQPYSLRTLRRMIVPITYTDIRGNEKLPSS